MILLAKRKIDAACSANGDFSSSLVRPFVDTIAKPEYLQPWCTNINVRLSSINTFSTTGHRNKSIKHRWLRKLMMTYFRKCDRFLFKTVDMTIFTHPVLKGPCVFLSVPTPSLRNQLKLKDNIKKLLHSYSGAVSKPRSLSQCSRKTTYKWSINSDQMCGINKKK